MATLPLHAAVRPTSALRRALWLAAFLPACGASIGQVQNGQGSALAPLAGSTAGTSSAPVSTTMPGMGGTTVADGGVPGGDPNMAMGMDPNMVMPNPCGIATAAGICDGNLQRRCVAGAIVVTDCAPAGQACVLDAAGAAQCVTQVLGDPINTFDVSGAPVAVEVNSAAVVNGALVYTVHVRQQPYQISCQATATGRSCTALSSQQALLQVAFVRGAGLTVTAGSLTLGGAYGPTVLRAVDLMQVADPIAFVLLDRNVLGALPQPTGDAAGLAAYNSLIGAAAGTTWDTVRFRLDLMALSAAQRTALATMIGGHVDTSPAGNAFVAEHMMICHVQGWLQPGASYGGTVYNYGGFTNGHRTYLREMETFVQAESPTTPFRRLPVFDPAGNIPPEFMAQVANSQIGLPLPSNFAPGNAGLMAYVGASAEDGDNNFGLALNNWHNAVHNAGGGTFGVIMTASRAPVFFCWHAGLDVLWDGFRLMTQLQ